ncbi:hypothetical protein NQ317_016915 [Molorchus minor]|uniref:Uncharacterized protein n=1 Tax=Molorchus minor TaxID=1323400 RepID=A0ABQ9K4C5_9CUCU|nr:hypothetical protein NQ317_016915 [Molorchus minor]
MITALNFMIRFLLRDITLLKKIADASGNEIGILDATPQPNWPHDLSYEKELCTNGDTEAVFKTVDKKILPSMQDNFKIKICKSDSTSSNENNDNNNTNNNSKSSQSNENDSKQKYIKHYMWF